MSSTTLADVRMDLEALAGWTDEIGRSMALIEPATHVLVQQTDYWRQDPPIIVRPPRMTTCFGCIEVTKTTVTAQDLVDALAKMKAWLIILKDEVERNEQL